MHYYPVLIPTLNRYEHFVRCVESLRKNRYAEKTELVIGLDYPPTEKYTEGYIKIREYLPTIKGFSKVTIFERESNYGPVRNFEELIKYAFEKYSAIILSEDDIEFAPNFLDFMNHALDKYEQDESISSVSGFNYPSMYNQKGHSIFLRPICVSFGLGLWKDKSQKNCITDNEYYQRTLQSLRESFKIFITSLAEMRMLIRMVELQTVWDDVGRTINNIKEKKYQLAPAVSLVRNHGYDGSGAHCGFDESFTKQTIDESEMFVLTEPNSPNTLRNRMNNLQCMQERGFVTCIKSIMWTMFLYVKYRFENIK